MRGVERQVVVTRQDVCAACGGAGRGADARRALSRSATATRQGALGARPHGVREERARRAAARAGSDRSAATCAAGTDAHVRSEAVPVRVPPGVADGARLRVAGTRPRRTARRPHRRSVRRRPRAAAPGCSAARETTSCMVVPIAVHEAVLGARIDVPSLEGREPADPARHAGGTAVPDCGPRRAGGRRRPRRPRRRSPDRAAGVRGRAVEGADARVRSSEQRRRQNEISRYDAPSAAAARPIT